MNYLIVISPIPAESGGGYFAQVPDLPGCMSDGETPEEAALNVQDAIQEWLDTCQKRGLEPPRPGSALDALMSERAKLEEALERHDDLSGQLAELRAQVADVLEAIDHLSAQHRAFGYPGPEDTLKPLEFHRLKA